MQAGTATDGMLVRSARACACMCECVGMSQQDKRMCMSESDVRESALPHGEATCGLEASTHGIALPVLRSVNCPHYISLAFLHSHHFSSHSRRMPSTDCHIAGRLCRPTTGTSAGWAIRTSSRPVCTSTTCSGPPSSPVTLCQATPQSSVLEAPSRYVYHTPSAVIANRPGPSVNCSSY